MAGISESQLYRYIGGESSPTIEPLVQIARAAGVSLEWLATGYGSRRGGEAVAGMRKLEESLDVADLAPARRGPAPAGEEVEAVTVAMFFQGAGVLIQELRLVPQNLAIRLVRGDSMEPTLR
ncbi:MAG: helix-turn-helix domain-containing protein, partial [SAR324 cluster bacterium]|nr:helix-turn-helix domain-containing protein [SAR324 cluster bacterium]